MDDSTEKFADFHLQTRQKLKEAYAAEFAATIERAEKQIILAKHGRRLLELLDDTPVVPGDTRVAYDAGLQARQILDDCDDDLKDWRPDYDNESGMAAQQQQTISPPLQSKHQGAIVDDGASLQTDLRTEDGSETASRTQTQSAI